MELSKLEPASSSVKLFIYSGLGAEPLSEVSYHFSCRFQLAATFRAVTLGKFR